MTIYQSQASVHEMSAAVLAGGASRRMGADKALMMLAGRTLLDRAVTSVSGIAGETLIIGDRSPYHRYGVPVVADTYPGAGPLGGIATALRQARYEAVLVVACDMPFLSLPLLAAMAGLPRDYDVLLPVTDGASGVNGGPATYQTLHAIYRRGCLPAIERKIELGELQVTAALTGLTVQELPESWLRRFDPDLVSFTNANRPGDWDAVTAQFEGTLESAEEKQ